MNTAATIVVVLIVLLVAAAIGWVLFTRWRAQRLGLPPPSIIPFRSSQPSYGVQPAPGGVTGWINDRLRGFRNRNARTAAGAYEGAPSGGTRGGRSGFDPDDAWDTRVGGDHDAYDEEQELGAHPAHSSHLGASTEYGGGGTYSMNLAATPGMPPTGFGREGDDDARGRSRGRSPGLRPAAAAANPFDDDAEPSNLSMRGVSPRPIDTAGAAAKAATAGRDPDSGGSPEERRSIFRENV